MPTSVLLKGEQVKGAPKQAPKPQVTKSPEPKQSTDSAPPVIWPTTFIDNPIIDHLGNNFEHVPLDQGHPRCIRTELAAIRCLRVGEGVISNLPHDQGELLKGIQEGDEVAEVAKLNDEWEFINTGDFASRMAATMANADALEPTYKEARSWSDWPEWQKAIEVELNTLKNAGTWEVIERPPNINIVDSKWVFHVKKDTNGSISKWKAQLVACGFMQVYSINYCKMFTPVIKLASI